MDPVIMALAGAFLAALFGGFLRGLIGIYKFVAEDKNSWDEVRYRLIGLSMLISGCIGIAAYYILPYVNDVVPIFGGDLVVGTYIFVGYMGIDAAEGIFKSRSK